MAATLIGRAADVAQKLRKAISATAVVLLPDGAARSDVTTSPTITAGTGAPAEAAPDGSLYLRTDGTTGDNSLYMRIGGAWQAMAGQTP